MHNTRAHQGAHIRTESHSRQPTIIDVCDDPIVQYKKHRKGCRNALGGLERGLGLGVVLFKEKFEVERIAERKYS